LFNITPVDKKTTGNIMKQKAVYLLQYKKLQNFKPCEVKMSNDNPIKTTCSICQIGCGVLAYRVDGQVIRIEGDPEHPLNKGVLCPKGIASLEYLYHPDRLKSPLKRLGNKGEGKWQAIPWDEATDIIAERLNKIKEADGPQSVAFMRGAAKGLQDEYLARFANLFGSPNFLSMGYVCYIPRKNASSITYGFGAIPDIDYPPKTIIVWGENISKTLHHVYLRIMDALKKGTKLIVVDPIKNEIAEQAHLWVRSKPGTDLVLALGMINVIINESLYDSSFVAKHTVGFDELKSHVKDYSPEVVSEITWVPSDTIRDAARLYAKEKPAVIQWGNGIDHNAENFQTARAICILRAITGNIGIPGGETRWVEPPILLRGSLTFSLHDKIPRDVRDKRLKGDKKLLNNVFYALQQDALNTMITGEPYPLRAAYVQGSNPLLSYPNTKKVYNALHSLDFLVVSDLFMTPTAALADIVLPSVMYLEYDSIVAPPYSLPVVSVQQQVTRIAQCRSDYEILKGLAHKMGFNNDFWDTEQAALDFILHPAGITFEEFRKIGILQGTKEYGGHERNGFATPSGKVEIYSSKLKDMGFDPLPAYHAPETKEKDGKIDGEKYPLFFTTFKREFYRHSGGRQMPSLRSMHPEPVVLLHPDTAKMYGIGEGNQVMITTEKGEISQKAVFDANIDPRVVCLDYGWWFPEKEESLLFGWNESNVNILIDDGEPSGKEMGTPNLRGIKCAVSKLMYLL
jgi:anaerobic selenocysteine-containing dehydrogenase